MLTRYGPDTLTGLGHKQILLPRSFNFVVTTTWNALCPYINMADLAPPCPCELSLAEWPSLSTQFKSCCHYFLSHCFIVLAALSSLEIIFDIYWYGGL